ncbi:hypothetical protein uvFWCGRAMDCOMC493_013 [Freshwater phage uvFW-CGR-AMD-COM-C493]|nr:hypothetical protein uvFWCGRAMDCOMC493_013 [Freshwater phage uvFW-CGR-AMD-COM-C493]
MTVKHNTVAPEALGQRPELDHNRYESGGTPLDFDGVSVSFGTPTKPHSYQAPTGDGETSRRLRRFALTLSRFQLPNSKQLAKRWKVRPSSVKYAEQIFAISAYKQAFDDDPTIGTMSTEVLSQMLNEPSPNSELFSKALSYTNTEAFDNLLLEITNPEVRDLLVNFSAHIRSTYGMLSWRWKQTTEINSSDALRRRRARTNYKDLAREIDRLSLMGEKHILAQEKAEQRVGESYEYGNGKEYTDGSDRWYPLYVSKPELPLAHTGKLGRRVMYTDTGRAIKNIGRLFSDPEERIFTRKTRALGAVVVIDCSGSMSLSESDIDEMIKVSAGATVLCYSSDSRPSHDNPNAYIVARKGRRVRKLPYFHGGNGVDAPALMYGIKVLRESSRQPVIWISDEMVTGRGDSGGLTLREETDRIKQRYGVIVCPNAGVAVRKLKQLQGKG